MHREACTHSCFACVSACQVCSTRGMAPSGCHSSCPPFVKHRVSLVQEVDLAALGDAADVRPHVDLHLAARHGGCRMPKHEGGLGTEETKFKHNRVLSMLATAVAAAATWAGMARCCDGAALVAPGQGRARGLQVTGEASLRPAGQVLGALQVDAQHAAAQQARHPGLTAQPAGREQQAVSIIY